MAIAVGVGVGAGPGADDAEYCGDTGAPVNEVAIREVAAEWRSGLSKTGERARVVQLAFEVLERAAEGFREANELGGGGSCTVFSGSVFEVPVAIKRYRLVCACCAV